MNYEEIMRKIIDSLTGDPSADITYLRHQMECYKEHDLAPEILKGINHLIYHMLPEETKKEIELELQKNNIRNEKKLKEAESHIRDGAHEKAIPILEKLIREEDGQGSLFRNDSVSEYYAFHNFFEEVLFRELYQFRKIIRQVPGDFSGMYHLYGTSLFEAGRKNEAKEALDKALRWNPIYMKPLFRRAEIAKAEGEGEEFLCLIRRGFRSAYTSADLARCYRLLGDYHEGKGDRDLADNLNAFSLAFEDDSPTAHALIGDLSKTMKKGIVSPPPLAEIWETCEEGDIPIGPNPIVLDLAVSLGHKAMKEGANVSARFLFGIAYDLTKDEKVKGWIDALPEEEVM